MPVRTPPADPLVVVRERMQAQRLAGEPFAGVAEAGA
jgi:hypothetical protein